MQFDHNNTTTGPNSWNNTAAIYDDNNNNNTNDNNNKLSSTTTKKSVTKKTAATAATTTTSTAASPEKSKRKQVKNACVNCQKACKKCDDGRPCKRCVKLGLTATCRDSDRKERKKGVKRGPYKKRQAYIKDKPVYPKLTEEHWKQPIYENVPQVPSQTNNQSIYNDFYDDSTTNTAAYCVPSQQKSNSSSLSPISCNSFMDESDEALHYAYGYGYTNHTSTINTTTSPPLLAINTTTSMLDHQYQQMISPIDASTTISGNVTPTCYSWDDNYMESASSGYNSSGSSSPIGCGPIIDTTTAASTIVQFPQPFPTTTDIIYQTQQQKELSSIIIQQPIFDLNTMVQPQETSPVSATSYWFNDMPIEYHQQPLTTPILPLQQQNYFEYSIPSQQQYSSWTF